MRSVKHITFLLLFMVGQCVAADFSGRVAKAKVAAASPSGAAFERSLYPHFFTAIQACIPAGSTASENLGVFVFVGEVTKNGALLKVEVEPRTSISTCFAEQLAKASLPVPPKSDRPSSGFPIEVEMRVAP
jgi:hypothetical protein